jgi:hypothetical protein
MARNEVFEKLNSGKSMIPGAVPACSVKTVIRLSKIKAIWQQLSKNSQRNTKSQRQAGGA